MGGLRWAGFKDVLYGTAVTAAMILPGADIMNSFPRHIPATGSAGGSNNQRWRGPLRGARRDLSPYLILGCVMDTMSMILLTIPIFFPLIKGLDFYWLDQTKKAIWFGVLALMVVEIGTITPPVGMNVYVNSAWLRDVTLRVAFRGVTPFLISDVVRVVILVLFPSITLCLARWLT
nr:TRAP transporter large permease subunit [Pseudomonas reactans]